jgi:hypothetical protein
VTLGHEAVLRPTSCTQAKKQGPWCATKPDYIASVLHLSDWE